MGELGVPVEGAGTDPSLCPEIDCGGREGEISELIRNHAQLFNSEDNYYWDQYKLLKSKSKSLLTVVVCVDWNGFLWAFRVSLSIHLPWLRILGTCCGV